MDNLKFKDNPYYEPEKCGLSIFWQIDTAGSYEYNIFAVWERSEDNTLWWDHDSGCSCPSPFDPCDHAHDLKPLTLQTLPHFVEDMERESYDKVPKDDIERVKYLVKEHLKKYQAS